MTNENKSTNKNNTFYYIVKTEDHTKFGLANEIIKKMYGKMVNDIDSENKARVALKKARGENVLADIEENNSETMNVTSDGFKLMFMPSLDKSFINEINLSFREAAIFISEYLYPFISDPDNIVDFISSNDELQSIVAKTLNSQIQELDKSGKSDESPKGICLSCIANIISNVCGGIEVAFTNIMKDRLIIETTTKSDYVVNIEFTTVNANDNCC